MGFERILSELKRRNVVRVAAVYTVTAWGLFQIVKTVFETFDFPRWTQQLTLTLLILGLPIALIISWAFERAPDGTIKRTEDAPEEAAPRFKFGLVDAGLLGAMALVLLISLAQVGGWLPGGGSGRLGAEKSVAVLPFATFSDAPETAYFADGLTEEVIHSLAQSPDLKVAGRTSAFYFKGKNEDLRVIGAKLGVEHVVEGSVRDDGGRLRVTAQLISVKDGFHLWSQTYDRSMDDALAIQSDIAGEVAEALKTKLGSNRKAAKPDAETYGQLLIAKGKLRRLGKEDLMAARADFRAIAEMSPESAEAWAGLAQSTLLLAQNHLAIDFGDARKESEAAIERALKLDPRSVDALTAKGTLNAVLAIRTGQGRYNDEALKALAKAVEINPRDADALSLYAVDLGRTNRVDEAVTYAKKALEIDPLNRFSKSTLAASLARLGQFEASERQWRELVDTFPDYVDAKMGLAEFLKARGRLDQAAPWMKAAAGPGGDVSSALRLANIYVNLGMTAEADATMNALPKGVSGGVIEALTFIYRGDWPGALAFAEAQKTKDADPWWDQVIGLGALMTGDMEKARTHLAAALPDVFQPEPVVTTGDLSIPLQAAHVLNAQGDRAQARRIALKVLAATETPPGQATPREWQTARIRAYAEMGERDQAIAELSKAIDSGWRLPFGFDEFIWLDRNFNTESLQDDPEFKALIGKVKADLAKQKQALVAGPPPA